jgi:D-3-phosphoglycerate dehydrogenase / 2-oxoglutarate reductase
MTDLKSMRVLVTSTSYGIDNPNLRSDLEAQVGEVVYNPFGRPMTQEELQKYLHDIDGFIAGVDPIDRSVIEKANKLKVIARYGVGVDRVDVKAAHEVGIVVTYTPGANSVSVAELAIGLMLSLSRSIPAANDSTKKGEWQRVSGVSLEGKTIGLLGFGAIGKLVARRLTGFDCRVIVYDPKPDLAAIKELGIELLSMEEVITQSDFLSLHLPVLPETKNLVNSEFLSKMKKGSYLVNTARGELIDETALYQAIKDGKIRGAALDTFAVEPPGANNPLLSLREVIVTPHSGAHTDGATNAMGQMALSDCLAVLSGKAPNYPVK